MNSKTWSKLALVFVLAVVSTSLVVVPQKTQASSLNDLLRKQSELQKQAEENKRKLDQTKKDAQNLQDTISNLDEDIAYTQSRITNTQDQIKATNDIIAALEVEITNRETELADYAERLRTAYINLYQMSQVGLMETVIQSDSLSEAVTRAQFVQQLQSDLQKRVETATAIKTDLETKQSEKLSQKTSLESLNSELLSSRKALDSQKNQKAYLLTQTQGEQAKYQELLEKLKAQQETLSDEIYQARKRSDERIIGGDGGYPWPNEPNVYAVDPWIFYKRQCTSYAAWKFQAIFGQVFYNTRPGQGSAWNWPALARDQGYQTSSTARANAIVSWPAGTNMPYGHVAWVERVNSNGTIDVSEYNWASPRAYNERFGVVPSRYGNATFIYP